MRVRGLPLLFASIALSGLVPTFAWGVTAGTTLDSLAATWHDLDSFATIGQCIGSPLNSLYYLCSPAQLSRVKKAQFEGGGMLSATDSVLSVADTLRQNQVNYGDVNNLFKEYNYTDVTVNAELNYVGKGLLIGLTPLRYQGQFEAHNPNLPLISLVMRKDMDVHVGYGHAWDLGDLRLSAGAVGALLSRTEYMAESTLVDLASSSAQDLVDTQKLTGFFFDAGASFEYQEFVSLSVVGKDFGNWFGGGQDHSGRYLFIVPDKTPKIFTTLSLWPSLLGGKVQVGASLVRFSEQVNAFDKQWFGTLSYYVGPLRILSGFRPDLFRTGLGLKFFRFNVTVAQEWLNKLETGRTAQPRFTLGVTSSL